MKGSQFRKRYVLLSCENIDVMRAVEKFAVERYRARVKLREGSFLILLTNQFQKESLCSNIESMFRSAGIVTVSGTIRKCLKTMKDQIDASS
ncbi:MAG: hypothetical protein AAE977_00715 [Thermoplasmataceae archaeon]|jgi:hypothetical protein